MGKKNSKKSSSRVGSFRGKISSNDERKKRGSGFGYLNVPDGFEIFKPEAEEKYVVDFFPYQVKMKNHPDRDDKNEVALPGDWWYKLPFFTHKNVGVRNEKVICPQSFGKPCPICDYRAELRKNDGDEDEIKELNTSDRNLYVLNVMAHGKEKEKWCLYDASDFKFQETFRKQLKDDERWEVFPHPTEGCSVKITFDEAIFNKNKYAEATRFDFVDRKNEYEDDVLDEIPNLEDCISVLTYEQLKAKFFEANDVEEEEEEEEKPKRKQSIKVKKQEPVEEEEEEEEEDENEEEEDENEEEEKDELSIPDQIEECETVSELLEIAKENPTIFKSAIKELRQMTKVRGMKKRMNEIFSEFDDLPFEEEEEKAPLKKRKEEPVKEKRKKVQEEEEETPKSKKGGKDKCEFGHVFGKDNDEFDECDDCPLWNPCFKKSKEK